MERSIGKLPPMGRKKGGWFEDLAEIAARLPSWLAIGIAVAAYIGFGSVAHLELPVARDIGSFGRPIAYQVAKVLGLVLQYLVPAALALGAVVGLLKRLRDRRLTSRIQSRADSAALLNLSWQDFERVVGELFRRKGFTVIGNDKAGPDGGVDLVLTRGSERFLVQCKQWRATMVGVDVVRQLFGVMAAQGATGGFVVSAGTYSPDAHTFAEGRNIQLISSVELLPFVESAAGPVEGTSAQPCPACGAAMVKRTAKRGPSAGQAFWGCSRYPDCRGTRAIGS